MDFISPARVEYIVLLANAVNWSVFLIGAVVGISLLIYIHSEVSNKQIKRSVLNA